jgi:hypothetical protein
MVVQMGKTFSPVHISEVLWWLVEQLITFILGTFRIKISPAVRS